MKIAIDARKWRDFGIGTYVRNLVRHLARLDHETTYFVFCDRADEATLRDLAENFVPVVDSSPGYSLSEHISIPLKLRRLGANLFHSPHYVLPLFCPTPSVVTIHDCIHLLFPQYLPSRMAYFYARYMMGSAIRRSALVLTVSEASRRDILRFYPKPTRTASTWCPTPSIRTCSRIPVRTRWSAFASATRCAGASCSTPATSNHTRTSSG